MRNTIGNDEFKLLLQLTESDPSLFMEKYDELVKKHLEPEDRYQLDYLKARTYITIDRCLDAEKLSLNLLSSAIEISNFPLIAKCNLVLAKCYNKKDKDISKSYLDVAYEAAKNSKNLQVIAEVLMHLGNYFLENNDKANSLKFLTKAEKLVSDINDDNLLLEIKICFGTAFYKFGEYHKALSYMTESLNLTINNKNMHKHLLVINNLATIYSLLLRFDDAITLLNQGIKIAEENQIPLRKLMFLFNLGVLNLRKDLYLSSYELFMECEKYSQQIGYFNTNFLFELYSNLAGTCRYLNRYQEAHDYLDKAEAICIQNKDLNRAKEIEVNKANLLIVLGEYKEAKKLLMNCRSFFRKHKNYEKIIITQMNLADYYEHQRDYKKAIALLKDISPLYTEYMTSVLNAQSLETDKKIKDLIEKYNEVKEKYDNISEQLTNQISSVFVGKSHHHQKIMETALLAAQHPTANVLITGETGTGKDIIANLIHKHSARSKGPFIAVNVSAISPSLIESEFFGHSKGAFTSAIADHKGFFQKAQNGTLFLDEIGDMPQDLQSKLLRVLETRKLIPVGSNEEISINCRIISSTNRNLEEMLSNNLFRLDLYHRLNTIEIYIPPLRDRVEDIKPLVEYYVELLAKQNNRKIPILENSFFNKLKQYHFPGNVRELRNLVERLIILCPQTKWDDSVLAYLPLDKKEVTNTRAPISEEYSQMEKELIINALNECNGKQKDAAKILNMSESTLTRRILKYHLEIYTKKGK